VKRIVFEDACFELPRLTPTDASRMLHSGSNFAPFEIELVFEGSVSAVSPEDTLTLGEQWLRRPQGIWLRRALFQVHLWTGIGVGLYVLMISVTGSAIVFRDELYTLLGKTPKVVAIPSHRLTHDEIKAAAQTAYPAYTINWVFDSTKPDEPTDIWMHNKSDGSDKKRLFNPYTGEDMGNSVPIALTALAWMNDFHTNLLVGTTGRFLNGLGAIFVTLLCLTGIVIWWPGIQNWRRSLTVHREENWKRFNWDLHSAVGIWTIVFVLMWGLTGIYLIFPKPFERTVNFFTRVTQFRGEVPSETGSGLNSGVIATQTTDADGNLHIILRRGRAKPTLGDRIVRSFTLVHFGTFGGKSVKAIWFVFGLMPAILFVTGFIMWWNRVLSPAFKRTAVPEARFREAATSD
jgi:uncharacterized iron-regulated membrane protein